MASANLRKGVTALLGMAVAVAFVGGLIVLVLNSGSGDLKVAPQAVDESKGGVTDTTLAGSRSTEDAVTGLVDGHQPEGLPLPPMGIDSMAFDWTTTDLLASSSEVWLNQLVEVDGTLWAIGGGWDQSTESEYSVVFTSTDGVEWTKAQLPSGLADVGQWTVTPTDFGVLAIATSWDEATGRPRLRAVSSADAVTWTETDLASLVGDQNMWVSMVASGDGVVVLAGAVDLAPAERYVPRVITIEKNGYVIQLMEQDWTYTVTDAATGEQVAGGSQESIWGHSEHEGVGIYDQSGVLVASIDWAELDRAGTAAYEAAEFGRPLVISLASGDKTITLNESTGTVTVTDTGGAVVFTGNDSDLWQGRPPTFTDASGEVLVVVPWAEWNAAHESAYSEEYAEGPYSRPLLLRSLDGGVSWSEVDVESFTDPGFFFSGLVHGPDGFLALGSVDPGILTDRLSPFEPALPQVYGSTDGVAWTQVSTNLASGDWVNNLAATDDGYLAIVGGETGTRVMSSTDGSTWAEFLSVDDLKLEFGNVWFDRVATGGLGTFVSGSYDGYIEPETAVATISREGRTLTVDGPVYTVTDDATGAVLFTFDESQYWYEEPAASELPREFKWGQGGLAMFDGDGNVVFAVSHREFEEAMSATWQQQEYYQPEQFLLYLAGDRWVRVTLPEELSGATWFGDVEVRGDAVVLIAISDSFEGEVFGVRNIALTGRPAG